MSKIAYIERVRDLLAARKVTGGELTEDEEERFLEELDDLHRQLSTDEEHGLDAEIEALKKEYA